MEPEVRDKKVVKDASDSKVSVESDYLLNLISNIFTAFRFEMLSVV